MGSVKKKKDEKKSSRGERFTEFILNRMAKDNGFRAALCRADNPDTEYQSWEYLASWCELDKDWSRLPFSITAASLARRRQYTDGFLGIGKAISRCYADEGRNNGSEKDSAKSKLRRLIACKSAVEACAIVRPILKLADSRGVAVNHAKLLDDLLYFNETTVRRWAVDFYGKKEKE